MNPRDVRKIIFVSRAKRSTRKSDNGRGIHLTIRQRARAALTALDALLPADPHSNEKLAEVMHQFVAMRDALIAAQRAGEPCRDELSQMNAIISSIVAMEFPSDGLQWKRVCETGAALHTMIDGLPSGPARA
jgi:hypothetical protein